ncbi:hypothetical protein, partial [Ruminococcus sp.]|uniref:hypothetical protein n=1 Tax=Ruminococcus sp. TaxID=41978 RepID=UPI001B6B531E
LSAEAAPFKLNGAAWHPAYHIASSLSTGFRGINRLPFPSCPHKFYTKTFCKSNPIAMYRHLRFTSHVDIPQ